MKKLAISLELGGRVLHEIRTDEAKAPIAIGRDSSCDWSVAGVDATMSARHAELSFRRGAAWIRDLGSRNGITCAGERVERRRLRAGEKYHVGACLLVVEAVAERDPKDLLPYHRLEQLNGPDAGRTVELVGPADILVGSDPACGICCLDPLVSREHAALAVKPDGSVWARDLGSRNGTSVNGTPLAKDKERMLRDGDILSVAYVEFRFTDKNVAHPRAHMLRKLGVSAATVAVVLAGWYAYASVRPSAKVLLRRALDLAAAERFDEAEALARDSADARGADAYARHRADVIQNVEDWRGTVAAWSRTEACISRRDWDGAQAESVHLKDWNWNATTAPRAGVVADRALALVRALRAAQDVLADGIGVDGLAAASNALSSARASFVAEDCAPTGSLPWASALEEDVACILPELGETARELRKMETLLADVRPGPDGDEPRAARTAFAALDGVLSSNLARRVTAEAGKTPAFRPSPAVESRAAELRAPLRALVRSEETFASNVLRIAEAKFDDVSHALPLPSTALAGLHESFPAYAEHLRELNDDLCGKVLVGWRSRLKALEEIPGADIAKGRRPSAIRAVLLERTADRVLEFVPDPSLPPARSSDTNAVPGCAYDAFAGIFDFFFFLEELDPDSSPDQAVSSYGNAGVEWGDSALEEARAVCATLRSFRDYDERTPGRIGALARMVARSDGGRSRIGSALAFAKATLRDAEDWAAKTFPARCEREGSERAKILGDGVRLLLEPRPDPARAADLATRYRAFKKSLPKWDGTDESARTLFDTALPGMSAHRTAWSHLNQAAASKSQGGKP